jgi:hypothetical protein
LCHGLRRPEPDWARADQAQPEFRDYQSYMIWHCRCSDRFDLYVKLVPLRQLAIGVANAPDMDHHVDLVSGVGRIVAVLVLIGVNCFCLKKLPATRRHTADSKWKCLIDTCLEQVSIPCSPNMTTRCRESCPG